MFGTLAWLSLMLALAFPPPAPKPQLRVLTMLQMKPMMSELCYLYKKQNPGYETKLTTASPQEILVIMAKHPPIDIVVADDPTMQQLEAANEIETDSKKQLIKNAVVLIAPAESELRYPDDFSGDNIKRVALSPPNSPLGKQSRLFMDEAGWLDALKDKIVDAKNPRAAIQSMKQGEAAWTFAYAMEAARVKGIKLIHRFTDKQIPGIHFSGAIVQGAPDHDQADLFMKTLRTTIARRIFENAVFIPEYPAPAKKPQTQTQTQTQTAQTQSQQTQSQQTQTQTQQMQTQTQQTQSQP